MVKDRNKHIAKRDELSPSAMGKVAVLMGGPSREREVSLMSGQAVYEALIRSGADAHVVDVQDDCISQLKQGKFDRAFVVLHGRFGEDGVVQGVLETLKIPYTGSGVMASALSMDKVRTKYILSALELPTLPFQFVRSKNDLEKAVKQFGLPLCVKPIHEGSSNGVSCVESFDKLSEAYDVAAEYHDDIIAEPWIKGREFTVAILDGKPLPVIEMAVDNGFYDYHAKYISDDTHFYCPAKISEADTKQLQMLAVKTFEALGCGGWSRVDFLQDQSGKFYITENNTVPGMTSHSLVPQAAAAAGINYDELVMRILSTARLSEV